MEESESVVADPVVLARTEGRDSASDWRQRLLYLGAEGARRWLAVAAALDYRRPMGRLERTLFGTAREQSRRLAQIVIRAATCQHFRTFISLGPGDARLDLDIALALRTTEPGLRYIPVDISIPLLRGAVRRLGGAVVVPLAVLGDFEDGFPFIAHQALASAEGPHLYCLLGNTLGNLDVGEQAFLNGASSALCPGDCLMLSVSTTGENWEASREPLFRAAGYPPVVQHFILAGTAAGVTGASGGPTGADLDFSSRVQLARGRSDVPRTAAAVDVIDRVTERPIFRIRRYRWASLLAWLRDTTRLEIGFECEVSFNDVEAAGVVLLRSPSSSATRSPSRARDGEPGGPGAGRDPRPAQGLSGRE